MDVGRNGPSYPDAWHPLVMRVRRHNALLRADPGDEAWTHERAEITGLPYVTVATLDATGAWLPILREPPDTAFSVHAWYPDVVGRSVWTFEVMLYGIVWAFGTGWYGLVATPWVLLAVIAYHAFGEWIANAHRAVWGVRRFYSGDLRDTLRIVYAHEQDLGAHREPIVALRGLALQLQRRAPVLEALRRIEHRAMGQDPTVGEDLRVAALVAAGQDDGSAAGALTAAWRCALDPASIPGQVAPNPWWERKIFA